MKRLPLIPTIIVGLAIAAMIALGVWQLQRIGQKEALIALYRANLSKPAMTFPRGAPVPMEAMFRPSSVMCLEVVGWRSTGGRAADDSVAYRKIAECRTGAEGPGALIEMGVSNQPNDNPDWKGGAVQGTITTEPDHSSVVAKLFGRATPLSPMLVSSNPAPGLQASARPNPETIPNNHLAYAGQWFFFALIAGVIYILALRKRQNPPRHGEGDHAQHGGGAPPPA
jgi:cytochrome oxidase assembly protein ShyY1